MSVSSRLVLHDPFFLRLGRLLLKSREKLVGPPPSRVRAQVHRGCPCWDQLGCTHIQGDMTTKRQTIVVLVGVLMLCDGRVRVCGRDSRSDATEKTFILVNVYFFVAVPSLSFNVQVFQVFASSFHTALSSVKLPSTYNSFSGLLYGILLHGIRLHFTARLARACLACLLRTFRSTGLSLMAAPLCCF